MRELCSLAPTEELEWRERICESRVKTITLQCYKKVVGLKKDGRNKVKAEMKWTDAWKNDMSINSRECWPITRTFAPEVCLDVPVGDGLGLWDVWPSRGHTNRTGNICSGIRQPISQLGFFQRVFLYFYVQILIFFTHYTVGGLYREFIAIKCFHSSMLFGG